MNKLFAGLLLIFSGSVLAQRNLDSLTKLRVKSNPMKNIRTDAYRKKFDFDNARYFLENEHSQRVSRTPLAITGMDGYDFAPIVANNKRDAWTFDGWKQEYISVEGNRDVWKDGNATYFLKPFGYKTDLSTNLMDFDLRFPEFTLPKNKFVIVQATPLRPTNYLQKGVSFVKDTPGANGFSFVGDQWLYDLGCPMAHVTTQEEMDKWCQNVNADKLLASFIDKVYNPNKDFGYVMLNWEAVNRRWNVRRDKIIRCLEYWSKNPHNAKLALWTVSGISIPRPIFQGINYDYTNLLNFRGDINGLSQQFKDWVSVDFDYAKYVEIGQIGGYQIYPNEDGIIHHYLTELFLHKKYNRTKTMLATIWHDQEPIANFGLDYVRVDYGGGSYLSQMKPRVTPSMAYNWGVWTLAVGDGFDCWSDPHYWSENKADWGGNAFDLNMQPLPLKYGEKASRYAVQPMKNIDWLMSGVWSVSANKDIIDDATAWRFAEAPSRSYNAKKVLIAYKLTKDNKEALVLALNSFGKTDGETTHNFFINSKMYQVKTYGRFTSVVRMSL
jgi:hypothetical protein